MNWIVSNCSKHIPNSFSKYSYSKDIYLGIEGEDKLKRINENIQFLVDGYVLPRLDYFTEFSNCVDGDDLVKKAYLAYGHEFLKCIKGSFNLLWIENHEVKIYNDYHSFKKFFYLEDSHSLLVTSSQKLLVQLKNPVIKPEYLALYSIMEHFVYGYTLYENVKFSMPATVLHYKENKTKVSLYFHIDTVLTTNQTEIPRGEVTKYWSEVLKSYITFLNPEELSLTITGGNDSRLILATLLSLNHKPSLWSFGNPKSFDGYVSSKISNQLDLRYTNHYKKDANSKWFRDKAAQLLNIGNGFVNIHRAHRLDAVQNEQKSYCENSMLFAGFMGGDYLKGLSYDDYITPRILRLTKHKDIDLKTVIDEELNTRCINLSDSERSSLVSIIADLPIISETNIPKREWYGLYHLVGSMHDMQDTTVFSSGFNYVVNPYMDIDFLQMLYKSKLTWSSASNNFLYKKLRINRSVFHLESTHELCPRMSNIEFAKTGYYTANEYLNLPSLVLLFKRYFRKRRVSFPQNFKMDQWILDFCKEELKSTEPEIVHVFDIEKLNVKLNSLNKHITTEGFWHLYTNPINLSLLVKHNRK